MQGDTENKKSIFWISVLALFIAAVAGSVRDGITKAMQKQLFDPIDAANSGGLIADVMSYAFLGFALSLLVISPLLDRIGAKRAILLAAACFVVGPILVLAGPSIGGSLKMVLSAAMMIWGLGWGATEASINPLATTLYPDDKTGKLNSLHAWWPFGAIVGGLLSPLFTSDTLGLTWEALVAITAVPGVILGIWTMQQTFPKTESAVQGVSFGEMLAEPFKRPGFWVFFFIMFLTASAELAPKAWVDTALTSTVGMRGILIVVYVSAIMFVMRHFAGALEHKFSDMGLLWFSTVPAAIGLYLLSVANSPVTALIAATFWAVGVCFMWPTMLAAVARRYPKSGPWGIGLIGFAGALAIYFVLPKLGAIYDIAKLDKAGGEEAFKAMAEGSPQQLEALAHAAEVSFQTIAIIPVVLFFIFGIVWFFERGKNTK
jgi:fucose permease